MGPQFTGLCLLIVAVATVMAAKRSYQGFQVLAVQTNTQTDIDMLDVFLQEEEVDIWNFPRVPGSLVTFAVSGSRVDDVRAWIESNGMTVEIAISDIEQVIDEEAAEENFGRMRVGGDGFNLGIYHDHSEINDYLESMASNCSVCRTITLGRSYEGRQMKALKIGRHTQDKKGIWIDAGIHAREWIAPATALYVIDKLVTGYTNGDPDAIELVESFVWYILPSANPDGYMFSRTEDRLWRKTRKPNSGTSCVGTDPNRNWDFHWMEAGTSDNPCSEIYGGSSPFSEPETRAISNFVQKMSAHLQMYLSFHSYGQYWLATWGYTTDLPDDNEEQIRVGQRAVDAIRETSGRQYTLGPCANVLYAASGGSFDWARGAAGVPYSYTAELRDSGRYGFLLPPGGIAPTGREMWNAILAVVQALNEVR